MRVAEPDLHAQLRQRWPERPCPFRKLAVSSKVCNMVRRILSAEMPEGEPFIVESTYDSLEAWFLLTQGDYLPDLCVDLLLHLITQAGIQEMQQKTLCSFHL